MNRRQFLLAGLALGARAAAAQGAPIVDVVDVIIVGGGLAGLRAAELLRDAGRSVVILEAQARPGGRVLTMRKPFDEGLHAEAGAFRIAGAHRAVLDAARRHRLQLVPLQTSGADVVAVNGRPVRGVQPAALMEKYAGRLPSDLSDPAFDRVTWPDWLRSRGASREEVTLMTVGADSSQVSALYVLRQYAMLRDSTQRYKIAGGMDRLPGAMAASLGTAVRYNSPVVRVERQPSGFRVDYQDGGTARKVAAARVIFAVPTGTLRRIEIRPALSAEKQHAVDRLSYYPGVRYLLQTRQRFWRTAGLSGSARTDRATEIWDATFDQPATRGILAASSARDAGTTVADGVDLVADAFPAIRGDFEKGAVYNWNTEPWARGAFALFRPGELTQLQPRLAAPENGIHFAGEHTSRWTSWMEGALESGERAAREVLAELR